MSKCTITIVKDEYAAEAESLDQLGLEIPSYMVVEMHDVEAVSLLPSPTMTEIDGLLARFTPG